MMLASIPGFVAAHSESALLILFVVLALESFGLPLPGGALLIACGVLASQGALSIVSVIVVASLAAVIGGSLGYWTARQGGRRLLSKSRLTRRYAKEYLPRGERFFARYGARAVFFGPFVAVLRVTTAWTAGLSRMGWWRFFLWNAAGAVVWTATVALIAYYLGDVAARVTGDYGLLAAGVVILLAALGYLFVRRVEHRVMTEESEGE